MKNNLQISNELQAELDWLETVLRERGEINEVENEEALDSLYSIVPPTNSYLHFINEHQLDFAERLTLILALVPHIKPHFLDTFFLTKEKGTSSTTVGKHAKYNDSFLPTAETVFFILAGESMQRRLPLMKLFNPDHLFARKRILSLEKTPEGVPFLNGTLLVSRETLELLTTGKETKPEYGSEFPASLLTTQLTWDDLVLEHHTQEGLAEIKAWIEHENVLMNDWGMRKKFKPGFRSLFYGPSGTGKTFAATLLGKETGRDVYRIDLSQVISKYIGETEKNLSKVFDRAENKNWILFFDEAEALFGKRTQVSDAHDRYANQEVAYLLQRVEDFNGVAILASNLKSNMDDAFSRRFQSFIYFPVPKQEQRKKIWENTIPAAIQLHQNIDLERVARDYELSGGQIVNIMRYCALMTVKDNSRTITAQVLEDGINKEFHKAGKTK